MKVNKIVKIYVVVFVLFLVSWNGVLAQSNEVNLVTGEENVNIGNVSNLNNLPECIVNVARSINITPVSDLPQYSYISVVDVHVPKNEESCHFSYSIRYAYLEAYRTNNTNASNCSTYMKSVTCFNDITDKNVKLHLEFMTAGVFETIPVAQADDWTNGVHFWWIFIGYPIYMPVITT